MKQDNTAFFFFFAFALIIGVVFTYYKVSVPEGVTINKSKYPVTGIDISAHTGKVDFSELKAHEINFVVVKATEGESFIDKKFERNYNEARKHGVPISAYHFFKFNKPGKKQAENFLAKIKGKDFDLPLVLDVEEWGNSTAIPRADVVQRLHDFIATVEAHTGKRMMLYSNVSGYRTYLKDEFPEHPLWICSFRPEPPIKRKWTFWQHSHKGKFAFADGWVDLNTFNGSHEEWSRFVANQWE